MNKLHDDANYIIRKAIASVQPDFAVKKALQGRSFGSGRVILVSVGKAGWKMAFAAKECLGDRISEGIVITKHGHSMGKIEGVDIWEAGHPIPDENSVAGTRAVLKMTHMLSENDTVLFLLSGGASALFEDPLIPLELLKNITQELLISGASIIEMNTIRKRISAVKGGKFARHCAPAHVLTIILSDIIGDHIDMIASGPTFPDLSTSEQVAAISEKYALQIPTNVTLLTREDMTFVLSNVETIVTGSVSELCLAAKRAAQELGYSTDILSDSVTCEAREAGRFLGSIARYRQSTINPYAIIIGGETVVHVHGSGLGGRNQELVLAAAAEISGLKNTAIFSVGSDGTDGPTDAAGGYVDGDTAIMLEQHKISIFNALQNNDTYHALACCDGLLFTGATGTNVNDVSIVLINR